MESLPVKKLKLHGKLGTGKFALVDGDYDGEYFAQYKWYLMPNGYIGRARVEDRSGPNSYVYLHQEVSRPPVDLLVDHINGNRLDNRSCNLRWCTRKQNTHNRKKRINSSAVYIGVYPEGKSWVAKAAGKHLGTYKTPEEAAIAYDQEIKKTRGEFAYLNFLA